MTETLISLLSVIVGIIAANCTGVLYKKYSFGIIGNTIIGVFGSVFLIKSFGRLGFDPSSIMEGGTFHSLLFMVNCFVSIVGGSLGLFVLKTLYNKMNE